MTDYAYSGKDRRRFKRINRNLVARVMPESRANDDIWNTVFIQNISKGGMLFNSDTKYKPQSFLRLSINILDSRGRVECGGKVIRCHPAVQDQSFDIAMEFVELKPEDSVLIERFIADYLNKLTDLGVQPD